MSSEQLSVNSEETVISEQLPVKAEKELEELKEVNQQQAEEIEGLKKEMEALQSTAKHPSSLYSDVTRGERVSHNGAEHLRDAAKQASRSGSRNDVHEYMRLRRNYV